MTWLKGLPGALHELERRWSINLGAPIDGDEVTCSWVAPVTRADGSTAMIKLGMPHMEAMHEIHGIRFWNGDPTVWLLEEDVDRNAMLMERCEPGTVLRARSEARAGCRHGPNVAKTLAHAGRASSVPSVDRHARPLERIDTQKGGAVVRPWPWSERHFGCFRNFHVRLPDRCYWRPTCMPATCSRRSVSHGWSSIRSRSAGIRRTMQPSISSIVRNGCGRIR